MTLSSSSGLNNEDQIYTVNLNLYTFLVPKFAGSHPAEAIGFLGRKNLQQAFLRREVKPSVPCCSFTACKGSLNVRWKSAY